MECPELVLNLEHKDSKRKRTSPLQLIASTLFLPIFVSCTAYPPTLIAFRHGSVVSIVEAVVG